jgi:hypothetical protein
VAHLADFNQARLMRGNDRRSKPLSPTSTGKELERWRIAAEIAQHLKDVGYDCELSNREQHHSKRRGRRRQLTSLA